jgi:hypothetical protein
VRRTSWANISAGTNLSLLVKLSRTTSMSDDEEGSEDNGSTVVVISAVDEERIAIVGAAIDRFCLTNAKIPYATLITLFTVAFVAISPAVLTSHLASSLPAILHTCDTTLCGRGWSIFACVSTFLDKMFAKAVCVCSSLHWSFLLGTGVETHFPPRRMSSVSLSSTTQDYCCYSRRVSKSFSLSGHCRMRFKLARFQD